MAQTMMADDWAGFNTTEESLQAQWAVWVDYAMATGSPIGVAGLEKTVVTAARFSKGKWVDVPVAAFPGSGWLQRHAGICAANGMQGVSAHGCPKVDLRRQRAHAREAAQGWRRWY